MNKVTEGWMANLGPDLQVAFGKRHAVEYLGSIDVRQLPLTPAYCAGVQVWRKRLIPVLDLGRLLGCHRADRSVRQKGVVVAYQAASGDGHRFGLLVLDGMPDLVKVSDDMACALPGEPAWLQQIACSCFRHKDQAVPILALAKLFEHPLVV